MSNSDQRQLAGKTALITGGASGIGRQIARRFAAEGANIVIADISEEGLEETARELGNACLIVKADVTSEADVEKAVAATVSRFGGLNIAVNSARTVGYRNKCLFERSLPVCKAPGAPDDSPGTGRFHHQSSLTQCPRSG
jgi:NAD(P)-dependent dehydrogenase (short-subunit alcohol dehydrogenase family)